MVASRQQDATLKANPYKNLFKTMPSLSLAEWRWGHLVHAVGHVLLRMVPLRLFWSEEQMLFMSEGADSEDPRRFGKLSSAIRNPFFWSYSVMIHTLACLVKDMELYAYSCNCHPERTESFVGGEVGFDADRRLASLLGGRRCLMQGRLLSAPLSCDDLRLVSTFFLPSEGVHGKFSLAMRAFGSNATVAVAMRFLLNAAKALRF